jgi:hypothetical protein
VRARRIKPPILWREVLSGMFMLLLCPTIYLFRFYIKTTLIKIASICYHYHLTPLPLSHAENVSFLQFGHIIFLLSITFDLRNKLPARVTYFSPKFCYLFVLSYHSISFDKVDKLSRNSLLFNSLQIFGSKSTSI